LPCLMLNSYVCALAPVLMGVGLVLILVTTQVDRLKTEGF